MKPSREGLRLLIVAGLLAALSFTPAPQSQSPPRTRSTMVQWLSHRFYLAVGGRLAPPRNPPATDPLRGVLRAENDRLHALLALGQRLPGEVRTAWVVRREPDRWWRDLEVEIPILGPPPPNGAALVLTSEGLIGTLESQRLVMARIGERTLARGTVTLLSAPGHQLSVVTGPGEQPFLLEGRGGANLALRPISGGAEKEIIPGDAVLTSGLGRLYRSRGLVIGEVDSDVHWARFSTMASTPSEVLLWWR